MAWPPQARALSAGLVLGSVGVMVRISRLPTPALIVYRSWVGALFFLGLLYLLRGRRALVPAKHRIAVVLSGACLAGVWIGVFGGVRATSVGVVLMIFYLGPLIAAPIAWRVFGERPSLNALVAFLVALLGLVLIVWSESSVGHLEGVALASLGAISFCGQILTGRLLARHYGALRTLAYQTAVAAMLVSPLLGFSGFSRPTGLDLILVLALGLVMGTGILLWLSSMERMRAFESAIFMYTEPASSVLWAALFLGEVPRSQSLLGSILIFGAALLYARALHAAEIRERLENHGAMSVSGW